MTGKDVKRQALDALQTVNLDDRMDAFDALASCVVLTREEAAEVRAARNALKTSLDLVGGTDWTPQDQHAALLVYTLDAALLSPDEAGDE